MDPSAALLRPRLRLRRTPSPAVIDTPDDATPQPHPRALFRDDDDDDELPTPRVFPKPIAALNADQTTSAFHATPAPTETPAARLRALLAREPRTPRDATPTVPSAPPSEADSAIGPSRFGSSTSSVARESLKDIFSRALRDPGDTPQKGRQRRNSDGSSMEITPVVGGDRGPRRAARRSLSDEEAEIPKSSRQSDRSFRLSTAITFDTLRARLTAGQSQLLDQNPPEALNDPSSSLSYVQHHQVATSQSNPTRAAPPVSTLTPHPSFQMSSQLALQSNLLEQDSEMQRAMGDVLNSETEASTSAAPVAQSAAMPSDSPRGQRRTDYELDSSTTSSPMSDREHRSNDDERNHRREREWNRQRLPSWSSTPAIRRGHSRDFHRRLSLEFRSPPHKQPEKRSSLVSLRSFDDDHGSRPSSIGSQADYRDRISELEQEKNHEREREWNRRHPPSRPSSSLSTSSDHSFSHSHSHPPRSPSATPYLAPTHASLRRTSSRTSLRSDSPASLASSHDSLKEREKEEKVEINHERERNWNSPRPHWSSKNPSSSGLRTRNNSLRSSPSRLEGSHGHPDSSSPVSHKSGNRSDERIIGSTQTMPLNGSSPGKTLGSASKFGWNIARSPLPPLELDDRRNSTTSPTPDSQPPSRTSGVVISSHTPVRSRMKFSTAGHMTSDMSFTHVVDDKSSIQHHQNEVVETPGRREYATDENSWNQEDMVLASDEESIDALPLQSTTPRGKPPNPIPEEINSDAETEILESPSRQGSPRFGAPAPTPGEASLQKMDDLPRSQTSSRLQEEPSVSGTPPGTPPSVTIGSQQPTIEVSPSYSLLTPPRQTSFGSSVLDFRTPSPPHDLPDLPGPPTSDDDALEGTPVKDLRIDANFNSTLSKTPKPPGAWAATPLPSKLGHQPSSSSTSFPLELTPPAFTSTPLPRVNSLPSARTETEVDHTAEHELLTPVATLSRARSLPLRTPAPPGAWMATPGQSALLGNGVDQSQFGSLSRKKGLLKVRFDVAESETSATEGHPSSPLSAIRLTNPELPLPKRTVDHPADDSEVIVKETPATSTPAPPLRPATPERSTTPTSRENGPSPRSLRRSPAVRLVDAFGRERVDEERAVVLSMGLPNGHADEERKMMASPSTPRRSLVRIVDAMGREVDDTVEIHEAPEDTTNRSFEADVSLVSDDGPLGHGEALARMRKSLRNLAESLSDADRSEDLDLNSSHLDQLEEVSQAARLARNKLAQNLRLETSKEHDLRGDRKDAAWTRRFLGAATKNSWNVTLIYCGVFMQLLLVLVMWRYANVEARRLFYTTYYDPLYPEFTPLKGSSCFSGTLSTSHPWTLFDSFEIVRREGWWSIGPEIMRAMRHVGSQAWEQWGEHAHFEKPT